MQNQVEEIRSLRESANGYRWLVEYYTTRAYERALEVIADHCPDAAEIAATALGRTGNSNGKDSRAEEQLPLELPEEPCSN